MRNVRLGTRARIVHDRSWLLVCLVFAYAAASDVASGRPALPDDPTTASDWAWGVTLVLLLLVLLLQLVIALLDVAATWYLSWSGDRRARRRALAGIIARSAERVRP